MSEKLFKVYCLLIALIVTTPLVGTLVNYGSERIWNKSILIEPELSGVIVQPEEPILSLESFLAGQYQSNFEKYITYRFVSRKTLTRVYNQLLYTVFHSTDNTDFLIGQDNYIFEKPYATAYLTELSTYETLALKENIDKLGKLTTLLKDRGVTLLVRMSPSKAEHYPEYLPSAYHRFVEMKQDGQYASSWYQVFVKEIREANIPLYDRYDLVQQMIKNGEIVFTKGGTHWTLAPLAEYINGLNEYMEVLLNRKLGRMIVTSQEVILGEMGLSSDSDIWDICWNAISVKPNYPSPHITYTSVPGDAPLRVFTVGQSFTPIMLSTIYGVEHPIWDETLFSWYDTRVMKYPSNVLWGTQISEQTDDYEQYLKMDIILVDILENGTGWSQFEFVDHLLKFLEESEVAS